MKILTVEFVKSVAKVEDRIQDNLSQIAFAGRSNVGKSSLINCLLNRKKMAKISSTPGKTRLLNYFIIENQFYFVDLPGYGYARASKKEVQQWQQLIERFILNSTTLKGIISLIDSRIGPTQLDFELFNWLNSLNIPLVVVATKSDKLSKNVLNKQMRRITKQLESLSIGNIIPFSAVNGMGKKEIWSEIMSLMEK